MGLMESVQNSLRLTRVFNPQRNLAAVFVSKNIWRIVGQLVRLGKASGKGMCSVLWIFDSAFQSQLNHLYYIAIHRNKKNMISVLYGLVLPTLSTRLDPLTSNRTVPSLVSFSNTVLCSTSMYIYEHLCPKTRVSGCQGRTGTVPRISRKRMM